jgi:23S rRNA (cytosine1962-C5)-methyltransferase
VDISSDAVARIRANAARNGVPHAAGARGQRLRRAARLERAGERYDTIVLDPPAFAKNKASVPTRWPDTRRSICARCGCSTRWLPRDLQLLLQRQRGDVRGCLHEASADSHTQVSIVEKRMQGRDHPVLVGVPETYYLKCFILRRVE